jgi:hypothetical protein
MKVGVGEKGGSGCKAVGALMDQARSALRSQINLARQVA